MCAYLLIEAISKFYLHDLNPHPACYKPVFKSKTFLRHKYVFMTFVLVLTFITPRYPFVLLFSLSVGSVLKNNNKKKKLNLLTSLLVSVQL